MSDLSATEIFSEEQLETWSALATVLEWLPSALDAQLHTAAGLTHFEYGILYALSEAAGHTLRMSTLADYANSSLSRLSRAVVRMENRGWVRRTPDAQDGRYTLAILTEAGRSTVDQATPGHVRTVQRLVFEPLTQRQAGQLRDISRKIMLAIRTEDGWHPPSAR